MDLKKRILIVDDNPAIHDDFKKVLALDLEFDALALEEIQSKLFDLGSQSPVGPKRFRPLFRLDSAYQGQEALVKVLDAESSGDSYSLIFIDVRMPPGWDGVETVRKIWEHCPGTEIILCTAFSDYDDVDLISQLGISDHVLLLKKPFDPVSVRQLALAVTTKWELAQTVKTQVNRLEEMVDERTGQYLAVIRELQTSKSELEEINAQLVQVSKLSALGEMSSNLAHEINNPLTSIILSTSLLTRQVAEGKVIKPETLSKCLTNIESTALHISKVIDGLRSISRDSSKDIMARVKISKIVDDTLAISNERYFTSGVELRIDPIDPTLELHCYSTQIGQVLLNLLNNAHDAVGSCHDRWVSLSVIEIDQGIEIKVTDSGPGISSEIREKIFQSFFTTKGQGQGTGLGLSISKTLVEKHRGTLELLPDSPNTCFALKLPKAAMRVS